MQPLLSKVSLACWASLLALAPLANAAIASPPPLTKVPQTTSTPKVVTPKATTATPVVTPVKTEAVAPTQTITTTTTEAVKSSANNTQATSTTPATTTIPSNSQATSTTSKSVTPTSSNSTSTTPAQTTTPAVKTTTTAATTENKTLATRLVLVLDERKVYAYQDDKVIASYPVAVGKKGWETPSGNFQVIQMVKDPIWENPWNGKKIPASLKGPIGIRWIGFWTDGKNTIGFHGTPGEHLLGQAVSHGCVRMKNKDVVALFEIVQPGTPVIVKNKK